MDIRQYHGSQKYLKAADLKGVSVRVTIRDCVEEEVGRGRDVETKPVVYFVGKDKGLVLNPTNGNSIAEAYGYETADWSGRQIELYPTTTDYAGKIVDCIRIRIPPAQPEQAPTPAPSPTPAPALPATPPPDEDVPF